MAIVILSCTEAKTYVFEIECKGSTRLDDLFMHLETETGIPKYELLEQENITFSILADELLQVTITDEY